ncbi:hypothetical protein [Prosthecobacter dejongeii]|uniref:Uncharacterized protein n=1 Tax=Prosthecobacter dejongeii TaxID=48465 RepID=A0A7W7YQK5_9BACT|nr:hypothetical protein [Prosthecobacter dejongeii]MBB5040553.1 hypothetical protein [Prosthecobacter dejongeii]
MFTITNHQKTLDELRNFENTRERGLIDPQMTAEKFTERLNENAQDSYEWLTNKGTWPPSLEDLKQVHKTLCRDLQNGGGYIEDEAQALKYEESCRQMIKDMGTDNSQQRLIALAAHTARCEGIELFKDHNSTVNRLALEAQMDIFLGRAQRPGVDQANYLQAVDLAQKGNPQVFADLIESNHRQAVDAKQEIWQFQRQTLGPDYSTNWRDQDPSIRR